METVKLHRTLKFTRKMLKSLAPCSHGYACAAPHLPAKISTDPEQNLKLAFSLFEDRRLPDRIPKLYGLTTRYKGQSGRAAGYMDWLYEVVMGNQPVLSRDRHPEETDAVPHFTVDPYQVAQALAHIADKLLTAQGK